MRMSRLRGNCSCHMCRERHYCFQTWQKTATYKPCQKLTLLSTKQPHVLKYMRLGALRRTICSVVVVPKTIRQTITWVRRIKACHIEPSLGIPEKHQVRSYRLMSIFPTNDTTRVLSIVTYPNKSSREVCIVEQSNQLNLLSHSENWNWKKTRDINIGLEILARNVWMAGL